MDVQKILQEGLSKKSENKKLANRLKKSKPKHLDALVHDLHEEVFEEIDCLACANCCKTTSPGMHNKDVERLAKFLKIKPAELIAQHMELDEDGEYVFRAAPCPFLGADNYCSVYEVRPLACREYPHTNRKRFYQVLDLSVKNTGVCPAVVKVFEGLQEKVQ
ncbi:MAG: YkgJ family cysteine cluster protein [Crocinitomicaceae bacterium]|nr:YkgJ family cysteine cluster protein [Crocinitomicaceae bacterium]